MGFVKLLNSYFSIHERDRNNVGQAMVCRFLGFGSPLICFLANDFVGVKTGFNMNFCNFLKIFFAQLFS